MWEGNDEARGLLRTFSFSTSYVTIGVSRHIVIGDEHAHVLGKAELRPIILTIHIFIQSICR